MAAVTSSRGNDSAATSTTSTRRLKVAPNTTRSYLKMKLDDGDVLLEETLNEHRCDQGTHNDGMTSRENAEDEVCHLRRHDSWCGLI